jgi:hypothetical protein
MVGRVVIILMLAHTETMSLLYDTKSGIHDIESKKEKKRTLINASLGTEKYLTHQ